MLLFFEIVFQSSKKNIFSNESQQIKDNDNIPHQLQPYLNRLIAYLDYFYLDSLEDAMDNIGGGMITL